MLPTRTYPKDFPGKKHRLYPLEHRHFRVSVAQLKEIRRQNGLFATCHRPALEKTLGMQASGSLILNSQPQEGQSTSNSGDQRRPKILKKYSSQRLVQDSYSIERKSARAAVGSSQRYGNTGISFPPTPGVRLWLKTRRTTICCVMDCAR